MMEMVFRHGLKGLPNAQVYAPVTYDHKAIWMLKLNLSQKWPCEDLEVFRAFVLTHFQVQIKLFNKMLNKDT